MKPENNDGTRLGAAQLAPGTRAVLFVVHVYREKTDGEEVVRIISARRADKA